MSNLYKQIWDELSIIDVSEHIEKKGNLSYLSWAWAYGTLMKYYPNNSYSFTETKFDDGTMMMECALVIHDGEDLALRTMWLPVMDYKNRPIANPDAFAINTARMRCLVKCISMFGLGHYIYAGEDIPQGTEPTPTQDIKTKTATRKSKPQLKVGDEYWEKVSTYLKSNKDTGAELLLAQIRTKYTLPKDTLQEIKNILK